MDVPLSHNKTVSDLDRLGLGQTLNFIFRNTALSAENVETLITLHDIADLADFSADAETGML